MSKSPSPYIYIPSYIAELSLLQFPNSMLWIFNIFSFTWYIENWVTYKCLLTVYLLFWKLYINYYQNQLVIDIDYIHFPLILSCIIALFIRIVFLMWWNVHNITYNCISTVYFQRLVLCSYTQYFEYLTYISMCFHFLILLI